MKIRNKLKKYLVTVASLVSIGTLMTGIPAVASAEENSTAEAFLEEESGVDSIYEESEGAGNDQGEGLPLIKEGFIYENGAWTYYKQGSAYTNQDIVLGKINGLSGWYYIKDGTLQTGFSGIKNNNNGWWYVKNGRVAFDYSGFAQNENGWWYIENGKVTFTKNDVVQGIVNGESAWWNVKGSKVLFNETIEPNKNGWWYIKNGKVQFDYTGIRNNANGWWCIKNGKVDFSYTGFANNENGWWYVENGKVTFARNDVIQGRVNGEDAWWNVKGSKVLFNETIENNRNGWWYIKNGKVRFDYNGVRNNRNGWWYIRNGKVDFSYTGIASNENGTWYIAGGKVDFNANGTRSVGGVVYTLSNGRITGTVEPAKAEMINKARNYVTTTGYMILVDRTACKVGIFKGSGDNSTLDKFWSCCVGSPYTPTITGTYKLGAKGLYFNTGTDGRCWYYSQIRGDYLFHSVIYDRSSSPVNIIDGTMGRQVSHGCVRLDVNNAKYIYSNIPSGSTIVIYN